MNAIFKNSTCFLWCVVFLRFAVLSERPFCDMGITRSAVLHVLDIQVSAVSRVTLSLFLNYRDGVNFAKVCWWEYPLGGILFRFSAFAFVFFCLGELQRGHMELAVSFSHDSPVRHQAWNLVLNLQEVCAHYSALQNLWVYTLWFLMIRTHTKSWSLPVVEVMSARIFVRSFSVIIAEVAVGVSKLSAAQAVAADLSSRLWALAASTIPKMSPNGSQSTRWRCAKSSFLSAQFCLNHPSNLVSDKSEQNLKTKITNYIILWLVLQRQHDATADIFPVAIRWTAANWWNLRGYWYSYVYISVWCV